MAPPGMPKTVSTPSSSSERTTDCAPVTRSGGTWRRLAAPGWEAWLPDCWFAEGADLRAEGPGRAVGALTVFVPYLSFRPRTTLVCLARPASATRRAGRCTDTLDVRTQKSPRQPWLFEGGASQTRADVFDSGSQAQRWTRRPITSNSFRFTRTTLRPREPNSQTDDPARPIMWDNSGCLCPITRMRGWWCVITASVRATG